jgi:ubiquinone/menaquinone biosynthesis C-methylase UbiE
MRPGTNGSYLSQSSPAGQRSYLPSATLAEYLVRIENVHPELCSALDFQRTGSGAALDELAGSHSEFDSDDHGRGDSYRRAQRDALVRWTGIRQLLRLAAPDASETPAGLEVLDVLGGDGTLARAAASQAGGGGPRLRIVTGDLSGHMVDRALAQGLPAVRQAAHFLFLRDASMDAVLLAYGTHHIPPSRRPEAVAEAVRVVRPGGRIVLHDFDESSPMAGFFTGVVHPNAPGGHRYDHFTRDELDGLFRSAGVPARIVDLYDPLIVRAGTEDAARARMCDYVGDMYGLGELFAGLGGVDAVWRLLEYQFDHTAYRRRLSGPVDGPRRPVVYPVDGQSVAEVPRIAIVATASKAGR